MLDIGNQGIGPTCVGRAASNIPLLSQDFNAWKGSLKNPASGPFKPQKWQHKTILGLLAKYGVPIGAIVFTDPRQFQFCFVLIVPHNEFII